MSAFVERAARALCEAAGYDPDAVMRGPLRSGDAQPAITWQVYVPEARDALLAALDPEDEETVAWIACELSEDDNIVYQVIASLRALAEEQT